MTDPERDLAARHAHLVPVVAGKAVGLGYIPAALEDDAQGWGAFGLLDAARLYRAGRGATFETWARTKIMQAIRSGFRDQDWLPRVARQKVRQGLLAAPARFGRLGPASALVLDQASARALVRADARLDGSTLLARVRDARQRTVLVARANGLSQPETGALIGLSPSSVSLIEQQGRQAALQTG